MQTVGPNFLEALGSNPEKVLLPSVLLISPQVAGDPVHCLRWALPELIYLCGLISLCTLLL